MYIYVQYTYVTDDTSMYIYVILRTCGNTCKSLYVCQLVWVQATLSNNNHTTYTYIYSTAPFGSGSQHGYLDPSQEQFFYFGGYCGDHCRLQSATTNIELLFLSSSRRLSISMVCTCSI